MGWIYLILSAGCSLLIAHLLKFTEQSSLRSTRVLSINYIAAAVAAFGIHYLQYGRIMQWEGISAPIFGLIAIIGGLFIGNFFIYSKSVDKNGVGVSIAAMRLSLLIPVLISIAWYGELLSFGAWLGVVLVFLALYLLMPRSSKKQLKEGVVTTGMLLLLLFLGTGLADSSLKIYEEDWSVGMTELEFMALVFICAFAIGVVVMTVSKGSWITPNELRYGILLGIPNLYSSIFLIYALGELNGAIAFTSVNLLNVTGGTLLGKYRWGDQVTQTQWIGLGIALVSITLLIV